MGRRLVRHSVTLFYLAIPWRFVALCALALALIPTSLAQTSQLIIPTFSPSDGWYDTDMEGMVSQGSSNDYYAQFFCDSSTWSNLVISVAVRAKELYTDGEATLFEDDQPVLTFEWEQGGVPYEIPAGGNHIYNYTIKAKSGSPDSVISVYNIFAVKEARFDNTEVGPTSGITLHGTPSSSTGLDVSTTTVTSSPAR